MSLNPILVVIPTYNEAKNIRLILEELRKHAPQIDILVVDDSSPDGTSEIVTHCARLWTNVHLIQRPRKDGLAGAYRAGFHWGLERHYSMFAQMDGDLSHSPREFPSLIAAMEGADFVIGSRYCKGGSTENWPWFRESLSRLGNAYARLLLKLPYADLTSGYTLARRSVLESIDLDSFRSLGYSFQSEFKLRVHLKQFRIKEIPICFSNRKGGQSKLSLGILWEALVQGPQLRQLFFSKDNYTH